MAFISGAGPYPEWPDISMAWFFDGKGPRYVFGTQVHGDVLTYEVPATSSDDFNNVEHVEAAMQRAKIGLSLMVAKLGVQP